MSVHLFPINTRFTFWYIAPVFTIVLGTVFAVYAEFHALLYNVGVDKPIVQNSNDKIEMTVLRRFKRLSVPDILYTTSMIKMEEWYALWIPRGHIGVIIHIVITTLDAHTDAVSKSIVHTT